MTLPPKPVVDVSAVIIHVGGFQQLKDCLATFYASIERVTAEAVVIDNRSDTPGLAELVAQYPGARLVRLPERMGYSAATNVGVRESSGRYVLWCNDDLLFDQGAVDRLSKYLDDHPRYAVAQARLLNPDRSFQPCFTLIHISLATLLIERLNLTGIVPSGWSVARSWEGWEDQERDIAVAGGACMMLRRDALDGIGGLDERFFLYTEEFDVCYRLERAGWRLRYLPRATIVHLGSRSTRSETPTRPTHLRWVLQAWRSRFAYLRKNSGVAAEAIYAAVFVATALPRVVITRAAELLARARGQAERADVQRAYARLHTIAAREALTRRRHDSARPVYPPL
jgi:GT2 family glycosyltransferase